MIKINKLWKMDVNCWNLYWPVWNNSKHLCKEIRRTENTRCNQNQTTAFLKLVKIHELIILAKLKYHFICLRWFSFFKKTKILISSYIFSSYILHITHKEESQNISGLKKLAGSEILWTTHEYTKRPYSTIRKWLINLTCKRLFQTTG